MKKINKLLFTILFVLVAFVSVKAAEIKTIDTSIYLLPRDGMTTDEVFVPIEYSYKTARVTNTDKVVVTYVEAYDKNGDYMWFSDVFEAGETYKIVLALGTASINDYISKTATVTLKTVGGNYTLTKEYLDTVNYTYSFEYTVPTEPLPPTPIVFPH